MSDPVNTTPPPAAPPPAAPPPPARSPMSSMMASMSQSELLVVAGAALLVLGDLVFGVLLRDFYAGDLIWIGAALALLAFWLHRRGSWGLPMRFDTTLMVLGAIVGLIGARDLIIELYFVLRNLDDLPSATYLLGLVAWAIGIVAMAVGAWQLYRGRGAVA